MSRMRISGKMSLRYLLLVVLFAIGLMLGSCSNDNNNTDNSGGGGGPCACHAADGFSCTQEGDICNCITPTGTNVERAICDG
ncbi:MAG: hypothetical protein KC609_06835 [Myxococcales bacterium]|nr:hypothetical protein [Myxococcales bacterium]